MSAATRHRRNIVVDAGLVSRNIALVRERLGPESFTVWAGRHSGQRFLAGFREVASTFGVEISDGAEPLPTEMRITQLLGGHPDLFTAVSLETHLLSVRHVAAGEGVSYGATFVAPSDIPVGLAPVGFADGIDRLLSGRMRVRVNGVEVPVVGRIAMDSISLDVSAIPDPQPGLPVVVYGNTATGTWGVREAAKLLGVPPIEIISRLSERAEVTWR